MGISIKNKASVRRRSGRPPKKSLLSKNPSSSPPKSSASSKPHVTLPESEMDIWFQSGPFSELPQGATPAEVSADLKLVRAVIDNFANILLVSTVTAVPSHVLSASPESSTCVEGFPGKTAASIEISSFSAPRTSSCCYSRARIQTSSVSESNGFSEPLTPESFYGGDTNLRGPMCDEEKRLMGTVAPFACNKLDATENRSCNQRIVDEARFEL